MSRGYAGLASRLESLAVRLDAANAAGATPRPASTPVVGAIEPAPAPAAVAPNETAAATPPTPATPAGPMSQAFDAMMRVLRAINPNAPASNAASPSLAAFLHSLARGLDADRSTSPMLSGIGIMINVSA